MLVNVEIPDGSNCGNCRFKKEYSDFCLLFKEELIDYRLGDPLEKCDKCFQNTDYGADCYKFETIYVGDKGIKVVYDI